MSLYPQKTNVVRKAQTDSGGGILTSLLVPVMYDAGSPATLDADYFFASAAMHLGAYTLLQTSMPGAIARNVTVGHTATSTVDTLGTIDIVGTDLNGDALTESITPLNGTTAQGTKCFRTISSITGTLWSVVAGADLVVIGYGDLIGLPDKLAWNSVLLAVFNAVREATAPTVTFSSTVLGLNTVDLNSVLNASTVKIFYLV
jgi:hypothetical protein